MNGMESSKKHSQVGQQPFEAVLRQVMLGVRAREERVWTHPKLQCGEKRHREVI